MFMQLERAGREPRTTGVAKAVAVDQLNPTTDAHFGSTYLLSRAVL